MLGAIAFKILGQKFVIEFSLAGSPVLETQKIPKIVQVSRGAKKLFSWSMLCLNQIWHEAVF